MEDYEVSVYYLGNWTGNGELEDFVDWLDHSVGKGYEYCYVKGDGGNGSYSFNRISDRELHTNDIIYVFK